MENRIRVLVVDDEEVVRLGYRRVLSADGFRVVAAGNGSEALDMMDGDTFDVVLLDMRMPGMDGLEVLRAIKERWPQSEVVVVTGYPSIDDRQRGGEARSVRLPGQAGGARGGDQGDHRGLDAETLGVAARMCGRVKAGGAGEIGSQLTDEQAGEVDHV